MNFKNIIIITTSFLFGVNQLQLNEQTVIDFELSNSLVHKVNMEIGSIDFKESNIENNKFLHLNIQGYHFSKKIGHPELPQIHRLIEIPQNATPRIEIIDFELTEYHISDFSQINQIFPVQPSLAKNQTIEDVDFEFNQQIYSTNRFQNNNIVDLEIKGQMRAVRLANLIIKPMDYNPTTGVIKVYKNIEFNIHFDGADLERTEKLKQKYFSPYFENNYKQIHNYQELQTREDLTTYPITYVILANSVFQGHLDEFIEWKTQKGFHLEVAYTNEIGSNTESLKAFVQNLYNYPSIGVSPPSFVLLVGDAAQLPTFSGNTGSHPTDLYYGEYTNDYLPEIYYGRFSAENPSQLTAQIEKTIEYEKYEMPDPSFLEEVVLIAGVDGSYASTYGNGQINYGNEYYFNSSNDIVSNTYLYPESGEGWVSQAIRDNVSNGAGFVNYTAHGWEGGWADPSFSVSDVPYLNNASKYPLMIGNCCITNQFESTTCFGEALLREPNKGAQGYIGGSNNTYWNEDFWWGVGSGSISANPTYNQSGAGAYDGVFHSFEPSFSNWFTSNSALMVAGNLAVVEAGGASSYYWEIYHLMGDPSVSTYLGIPTVNNVSYNSFITLNETSIEISAEPYSYVGITKDGILIGNGLIEVDGSSSINLFGDLTPGEAQIVVTGQNLQPFFGTFEIGTAEGPYIILDSYNFDNTLNENPIIFGNIVEMSFSLMNIGIESTNNLSISLSTENQFITILNGEGSLNNISPSSLNSVNGFSYQVAENIPNEHSVEFNLTIQSNTNIWNEHFIVTANSPEIVINNFQINNLEIHNPGEMASYTFTIQNDGNSPINYPVADINLNDGFAEVLNITTDNAYYLDINETMNIIVEITANANTPPGHIINGYLNISTLSVEGFLNSLPFSFIVGNPPSENVNIEIFTDGYGSETSWVIQDISGNTIESFNDGNLENSTTYNWDVNLEYGDYTFIIYDSYGDGICCGYGVGYYSVTVSGEEVVSGGEFISEEATLFSVGPNELLNPPQSLNVEIAGSACESILISWEDPEMDEAGSDDDGSTVLEPGMECDGCDTESCIYDCELQCVSEETATSWVGDGYCDDGTYGMYLDCEFFNNDGDDCAENPYHLQNKPFYYAPNMYRDLTGYNLYKNGQLLTSTPSTQYSDSQIQIGNEYCYSIQAVYTNGVSSSIGPNCILAEIEFIAGDLNDDGFINVIDIVQLVNYVLNINVPEPHQYEAADLNNDDVLNVVDIVQLVNLILDSTLLKSESKLSFDIHQSLNNIKIISESNIAGFELHFNSEIEEFNHSIEGWEFYFNKEKLLGVNLEGIETNEIKLPLSSDYSIVSNIIVDWNLNSGTKEVILIPEDYKFQSIYPNPFNPVTTIPFAIPVDSQIKIDVYDLRGNHIDQLVNQNYNAGFHQIIWSPNNISSGLYFIQFQTPTYISKQKVIFIK